MANDVIGKPGSEKVGCTCAAL